MLCALTVRKLRAGTFEEFKEAFTQDESPDTVPEGWVRFDMIRNVEEPDEVICFGLFDGPLEALRASGQEGYAEQLRRVAPFVESVGSDGIYDVVFEWDAAARTA